MSADIIRGTVQNQCIIHLTRNMRLWYTLVGCQITQKRSVYSIKKASIGEPMSRPTRKRKRPLDRFLDKTITMPNGCWLWTASCAGSCGSFIDNYVLWHAHRWSYNHFIGGIPDGFVVHHKCRERFCVNPYHLEAMSHGDHQTLHNRDRTHCKHGHEFTHENTKIYEYGGQKARYCITCRDSHSLRHRSIPENREIARARARAYYWANPELGRAKQREYHMRKTHN